MARRRDPRQFGPGPYVLGLERRPACPTSGFPYELPVIAEVEQIRLDRPVTLLAGDNGTGKSTFIEMVAQAIGFAPEGGELERSGELPAVPRDVEDENRVPVLGPVLSAARPRHGYFLRAESFFNVAQFVDDGSRFAPDLSLYGERPLHQQSHGESFLALASNRFGGDGIYILDEPEAALSVTGTLALLSVIIRAAVEGSQFIVATHSPILLACPDAGVYELSEDGIATPAYDDLEAVRLTRAFLDAPARYLRAIAPED